MCVYSPHFIGCDHEILRALKRVPAVSMLDMRNISKKET